MHHVAVRPMPTDPYMDARLAREMWDDATLVLGDIDQGERRSPWRIARGIASTAVGIMFGALALLAVVVAVSSHLSPAGQLRIAGHPVMSVLSGSMAPIIDTGDLIVDDKLTPLQAASLRPGQIISFRPAADRPQIFTHRIVAVEVAPDGSVAYLTKGDANDSRDDRATPSTNIVGLYHSRVPAGGYVLAALHRPQVLGLLLASPLLWLLSGSLWSWARDTDEPTVLAPGERGESRS